MPNQIIRFGACKVRRLNRALDLKKFLPDLTTGATIGIHSDRRVSASSTCKVRTISFFMSGESNVGYFRLKRQRASA